MYKTTFARNIDTVNVPHTYTKHKHSSESKSARNFMQFHVLHKNHCHVDLPAPYGDGVCLAFFTCLPSFAPTFLSTHSPVHYLFMLLIYLNR